MPIKMSDTYFRGRLLNSYSPETGVCILAAGLAKRLEPISGILAKPAFPLAGRVPIVELWVRKFADAGLGVMWMNLHRVPKSIRDHLGDGTLFWPTSLMSTSPVLRERWEVEYEQGSDEVKFATPTFYLLSEASCTRPFQRTTRILFAAST